MCIAEIDMTKKNPTMSDLALLSGISKMTISRVFSGKKNVSSKTRERVLNEAKRIDYKYNQLAGNFYSGKTRLLGVGLPVDDLLSDEYFRYIFKGINSVASGHGYHLVILDTSSDDLNEIQKLDDLVERKVVDGIIAVAPFEGDRFLDGLEIKDLPIVIVGGKSKSNGVFWVDVDNKKGIRLLIEHLINLGHKEIGFISGKEGLSDAEERDRYFRYYMKENGLDINSDWFVRGHFSFSGGKTGMAQILSSGRVPTAILASNHLSALGAIDEIKQRGMNVPNDISVVCFDVSSDFISSSPKITGVKQPLEEMGREAVYRILHFLNEDCEEHHLSTPILVLGDSSAKLG